MRNKVSCDGTSKITKTTEGNLLRVNKIVPTKSEYGLIYDVALPIRFFFSKDGSFDGIEVSVEKATEQENKIVEDLLKELAQATGKQYYRLVGKVEDENEVIYEDNIIKVRHDDGEDSDEDKVTVQYKGTPFKLIGFDEVTSRENGKTEFLLKVKPDKKQVLVYPLRIRNLLKPGILVFIIEQLGYSLIDMRDILDHHETLEKKFQKSDALTKKDA